MTTDFDYVIVSADQIEPLIDHFIDDNGDGEFGEIPVQEFDQLFDLVAFELSNIGKFAEGRRSEGDELGASRDVDLLPFIDVLAEKHLIPKCLIDAAILIIDKAHRKMGIRFDFETEYVLVFPENKAFGTIEVEKLSSPIAC
ncbi:MAG: hypothetical protein AAF984_00570 [Verrucomicrobiota bacterium]